MTDAIHSHMMMGSGRSRRSKQLDSLVVNGLKVPNALYIRVDDKGWIKIVAHVTDDRRCPNEIDSSWTWRKHEGTSSIDYDAEDNLAVSCEGETGEFCHLIFCVY